jgi:hypothetical protein
LSTIRKMVKPPEVGRKTPDRHLRGPFGVGLTSPGIGRNVRHHSFAVPPPNVSSGSEVGASCHNIWVRHASLADSYFFALRSSGSKSLRPTTVKLSIQKNQNAHPGIGAGHPFVKDVNGFDTCIPTSFRGIPICKGNIVKLGPLRPWVSLGGDKSRQITFIVNLEREDTSKI